MNFYLLADTQSLLASLRVHQSRFQCLLARAKVNKGGRPFSPNPRKLISLRLPTDVIERWKATGPGWQTRMAERLSKVR